MEATTHVLEATVAQCRALACDTRLTILFHLCRHQELPSSRLADLARIPQQLASDQLAQLTTLGFLNRRRSGARVYYSLADPERGAERRAPISLVRRAFDDSEWATRGWTADATIHLASHTPDVVGHDVARVMDVIFDAATAFANVRRLQILRLLREEGALSVARMGSELHMSPQACWRHLDKLTRRGYVRQEIRGDWRLAGEHRSPFHAQFLRWVLPAQEPESRTSTTARLPSLPAPTL